MTACIRLAIFCHFIFATDAIARQNDVADNLVVCAQTNWFGE
jgi:hypothetical protein